MKQQPSHLPDPSFPENGIRVLSARYIEKGSDGKTLLETAGGRIWNVAYDLSEGTARYLDGRFDDSSYKQARLEVAEQYYQLMASGDFLPNSPTLMNAGKNNGLQYSACYVLPIEDTMDGIFETVKRAALVHKSGGGTGFAFSRLRPAGDPVGTTGGIASGPISFMEVFNAATEQVKQGGTRRGANMGILRVDHPDVMEWINCKRYLRGKNKEAFDLIADSLDDVQREALRRSLLEGQISNFNISVAITDEFMHALEQYGRYDLIHPVTGAHVDSLSAEGVFKEICDAAWETGDPGLIFIDRINKSSSNPCPSVYQIESTNPCGEQSLEPNGVCNLGSLNLAHYVLRPEHNPRLVEMGYNNQVAPLKPVVDWSKLERDTKLAVQLLDDVIEVNPFPDDLIRDAAYATRRLGLGVMGWADMLVKLEIPYDSEEAVALGKQVMKRVNLAAHSSSAALALKRGPFPLYDVSIYAGKTPLRNGTLTTVAPTGTISIISGCSSGIEPLWALAFDRHGQLDGKLHSETNAALEEIARREGWWTDDLGDKIKANGSARGIKGVPAKWQRVFVTAHEISPEWHIRMQAAWQKYVDNGISKTINLDNSATVEDIREAYLMAWKSGCKGTTVYRDGCKIGVFGIGSAAKPEQVVIEEVKEPSHMHPRQRPTLLRGQTYSVETPLGTAYITINEDEEGEPFEVFVNQGKAGSDVAPLAEAIGKLTSLNLRLPSEIPPRQRLEEISRRLRGVGGSSSIGFGSDRTRSLPDALAKVLDAYETELREVERSYTSGELSEHASHREGTTEHAQEVVQHYLQTQEFCPDCHCVLYAEEGCTKCQNCGYSRC